MSIKVHYRITQDRAGIPQDFTGARRLAVSDGESAEEIARSQLARDYQIPESAVEIHRIEH